MFENLDLKSAAIGAAGASIVIISGSTIMSYFSKINNETEDVIEDTKKATTGK